MGRGVRGGQGEAGGEEGEMGGGEGEGAVREGREHGGRRRGLLQA